MTYFLIVYDTKRGELIEGVRSFAERDLALALEARFEHERGRAAESGVEVVVLRAESEAEIRRTHGRYFGSAAEVIGGIGEVLSRRTMAATTPGET